MALQLAPEPPSLLGRHRLLAPTASIRVSPICLGSMNFGNAWKEFMGECDKKTAFEMMDFFYSQGGNFIDTANNYQDEESEMWIGEWMKQKGNRDQMVIATKYASPFRKQAIDRELQSAFYGNSTKSLRTSVEASLRKLQTDYIDILYLHWWDYTTSIPELMQSLNQLVSSGKVLYLGISDTPAWVVSKANEYARNHGLRPFSLYQGRWSAAQRDFERDIIPMCKDEGMGLAPWGALGGGNFKSAEDRQKNEGRKMGGPSEAHIKVSEVLEGIAKKKGTLITSVALAYVMHKAPYVFPICGGRKIDHLKGNIEALGLELSQEDMDEIDGATPFDIGFPNTFLSRRPDGPQGPADIWFSGVAGKNDYVEGSKVGYTSYPNTFTKLLTST
ncbi:MAG: hypothetical protein M1835_002946 [Candelina submexicana]|nr:MAG: hypothetical protein M1835_002946 [Candelina submexicana]